MDAFGEEIEASWVLLYSKEMGHPLVRNNHIGQAMHVALDGYKLVFAPRSAAAPTVVVRSPSTTTAAISFCDSHSDTSVAEDVVATLHAQRGSVVYGAAYMLEPACLSDLDTVMGPAFQRTLVLCRNLTKYEQAASAHRHLLEDVTDGTWRLADSIDEPVLMGRSPPGGAAQCDYNSGDELYKAWVYLLRTRRPRRRSSSSNQSLSASTLAMPVARPSTTDVQRLLPLCSWMPLWYVCESILQMERAPCPLGPSSDEANSSSGCTHSHGSHSGSRVGNVAKQYLPVVKTTLEAAKMEHSMSSLRSKLSNGSVDDNDDLVWYFAYGSNMSRNQLFRRVGFVPLQMSARLDGFRFAINKPTMSNPTHQGYANIVRVSTPLESELSSSSEHSRVSSLAGDTLHTTMDAPPFVCGIAYQLTRKQLAIMDGYECGYSRAVVEIEVIRPPTAVRGAPALNTPTTTLPLEHREVCYAVGARVQAITYMYHESSKRSVADIIPTPQRSVAMNSTPPKLSQKNPLKHVLLPARSYMETIREGCPYLPENYAAFLESHPVL